MWEAIEENRSKARKSVTDVCDGSEYRKLLMPGGFLQDTTNITCFAFIDGIPLFKSSSTSLWPVYLLINEISSHQRFSRKNMILWGVWQGVGKPSFRVSIDNTSDNDINLYMGFPNRKVFNKELKYLNLVFRVTTSY